MYPRNPLVKTYFISQYVEKFDCKFGSNKFEIFIHNPFAIQFYLQLKTVFLNDIFKCFDFQFHFFENF